MSYYNYKGPFRPEEKLVIRAFAGELKSRTEKANNLPRNPPIYSQRSMARITSQLQEYKRQIVRRKRRVGLKNNYSEVRLGHVEKDEKKIWRLIYDIASLVGVEEDLVKKASRFSDLERVIEETKIYIHVTMHEIESREREKQGAGISQEQKERKLEDLT